MRDAQTRMKTNAKIDLHRKAVATTAGKCYRFSQSVKLMPEVNCGFDILLDGAVKLEVKAAKEIHRSLEGSAYWLFNIHRHGVIHREKIDFYILYLPPLKNWGFKSGISLVIPGSEINCKTISISARSLMVIWSKWFNRWDLIKAVLKSQNNI